MHVIRRRIDEVRDAMKPLGLGGMFVNSNPKAKLVYSRDGKQKGRVLDGERICKMDGCSGIRLAVRWFRDLHISWPCVNGMTVRPDGQWQIL